MSLSNESAVPGKPGEPDVQEPDNIDSILEKDSLTYDDALLLAHELIKLGDGSEETTLAFDEIKENILRRYEIIDRLNEMIPDEKWPDILELIFSEPKVPAEGYRDTS